MVIKSRQTFFCDVSFLCDENPSIVTMRIEFSGHLKQSNTAASCQSSTQAGVTPDQTALFLGKTSANTNELICVEHGKVHPLLRFIFRTYFVMKVQVEVYPSVVSFYNRLVTHHNTFITVL